METPTPTPTTTEPDSTSVTALADIAAAKGLPAFCVLLEGSGLWPRAYAGSLLICSTVAECLPGDIVLAAIPPGGPVKAMILNADGDLLDMRRSWVPFEGGSGYQLVGTVTESLRPPLPAPEARTAASE